MKSDTMFLDAENHAIESQTLEGLGMMNDMSTINGKEIPSEDIK